MACEPVDAETCRLSWPTSTFVDRSRIWKYEKQLGGASLERVAQVISLLGDHDSMERLVKLEVLSVALGNLDLHAKNLSILHLPDGSMSLAPAYDVVPQLHQPNDGEVALAVGGEYRHAAITMRHFVAEGQVWGLTEAPPSQLRGDAPRVLAHEHYDPIRTGLCRLWKWTSHDLQQTARWTRRWTRIAVLTKAWLHRSARTTVRQARILGAVRTPIRSRSPNGIRTRVATLRGRNGSWRRSTSGPRGCHLCIPSRPFSTGGGTR
jgi:hypothetical protein